MGVIPWPRISVEHAVRTPVALVARSIRNSSREGEIIYDPFSGSGTTIIAAEQLGRRCQAMEISEQYTQVTLERWKAWEPVE